MNPTELFTVALPLPQPWHVTSVEFKAPDDATPQVPKELHIELDFTRGSLFSFPGDVSGKLLPAHDTVEKTWRHLNFWQYKTYIHARVPRIKNGEGKISMVDVPWARSGSGFTLMFEAMLQQLAINMPVNSGGRRLCSWLVRSCIDQMKRLAKTLKENLPEILHYWDLRANQYDVRWYEQHHSEHQVPCLRFP